MNPEENILDRDTYRKIKGYGKQEMSDFLSRVYNTGKNSIYEKLDLARLRTDIGAVKGIGKVKLAEIMEIILNALGFDDVGESEETEPRVSDRIA